ncbi:MAG: sodium:alanine symporter family protein [bacterium]|nr:sodium:alanine symporter family protein [bacterium]
MDGVLWGPIMIVLLVGTGVYLTVRLGFLQIRFFKHGVKCITGAFDDPNEEGDVSHFQALSAALAATIGTGNIAGVATAIALGGPGAVFWMWMTALIGMATKFASCTLALRYRHIAADGTVAGGPMHYLTDGLGLRWLGVLFALFAGLASFGIGCAVQSNSVVDGLLSLFPSAMDGPRIPESVAVVGGTLIIKPAIGLVLAVLVGMVILGGIKRIATVASRIVPFMCVVYVLGALIILARNAGAVPGAFAQIFEYAFSPLAVGGGFVGVVMQRTLRMGVARGVFSNEAGLGSAPMAHAAAKTKEPVREGFVAMLGPFIDTIVVCSMTALVIIVTGAWQVKSADGELLYGPGGKGLPMMAEVNGDSVRVVGSLGEDGQPFVDADGDYYPVPTGAALTASAFEQGLGHKAGAIIVALGIMLFAYSTMISWSYYGDRCWLYLLGEGAVKPYRLVFCVFVIVGTVSGLEFIWNLADSLNALMAIPNLVALLGLGGVVAAETKDYVKRMKEQELL